MRKQTKKSFVETIDLLRHYVNKKTGQSAGLIADDVYAVIQKHGKKLEQALIHDRDFDFDYFGFKTLERSYLLKIDGKIAETPQHMYMRVAVGIWKDNIQTQTYLATAPVPTFDDKCNLTSADTLLYETYSPTGTPLALTKSTATPITLNTSTHKLAYCIQDNAGNITK